MEEEFEKEAPPKPFSAQEAAKVQLSMKHANDLHLLAGTQLGKTLSGLANGKVLLKLNVLCSYKMHVSLILSLNVEFC